MEKVNVMEKFALIGEHWQPRVIAELNDQSVKIVKMQGEFIWHHHDAEDELFYVLRGSLTMRYRNRDQELNEGELVVVPRGVEHKPVAAGEAWVLLFEPASTVNTGNVRSERTIRNIGTI